MTKQDFEALAALLKAQRSCHEPDKVMAVRDHLDNLAMDMAQYMTRYPAFDQARFLAAAGVQ